MSLHTVRTVAGRAFALLVAGLVVVVLGLTIVAPRVMGASTYTILTGSMRPGMPPGTVVVIKPAAADHIGVGDVVTYQIHSGDPTVATHRVRTVSVALNGDTSFVTQGDANNAPDPNPVRPVQVRGKLVYAVPYVGLPSLWIGIGIRQVVVMGAVALLLAYAAASFIGGFRDRRRGRTAATAPSADALELDPELVGADR
jgi:signal peptidase